MKRRHQQPRTDVDRLNALIAHYDSVMGGGPKMIRVRFTTKQLAEFALAIEGNPGRWLYRGHTLVQEEVPDGS